MITIITLAGIVFGVWISFKILEVLKYIKFELEEINKFNNKKPKRMYPYPDYNKPDDYTMEELDDAIHLE